MILCNGRRLIFNPSRHIFDVLQDEKELYITRLPQQCKGKAIGESMYRKRIYFNLLQTQVHLLYGCTFFLLALLGVLWWLQFYKPLCAANRALETDLTISYQRLRSQKKSEISARELNAKFSDLKTSMSGSGIKQDAALCSLVSLAQKNGLAVVNARLCRQKNKAWCHMQEVQTECRGSYDQLITFFEQLSTHKPLISCKNCDITRVDKDTLTARALFHTYLI